jgi:hexosaminidase
MNLLEKNSMNIFKEYLPENGFLRTFEISEILVPAKYPNLKTQVDSTANKLGLKISASASEIKEIRFNKAENKNQPALTIENKSGEAHKIRISKEGIEIHANSEKGFFAALKTLEQMHEAYGNKLPCGITYDYPDIPMRAYHLDLKAGFINIGKLKELAEALSKWKINTLLIEYEDCFQYESTPEIARPDAPSAKDWAEFLEHCRSLYFDIIPLVQTHGHLEFLLKHSKYEELKENNNINEICPSNPKAVKLIKRMLTEIMVLHEKDEYVHIGGDETWNLCTCPKCAKRLKSESNLDVFIKHILDIAGHVKSRNKKVMMWCDMFWRSSSPEKVAVLPKDITLCEWIYDTPPSGSNSMFWNGKPMYSAKYAELHPESGIPAARYIENSESNARKFANKYFQPDPQTGIGSLSPYYKYFSEKGYDVIGSSAARCGQSCYKFGQANLRDRFYNVTNWSKFVKANNGKGVIITSWARSSGRMPPYAPIESVFDTVAAGALSAWNTRLEFDDFVKTASTLIYSAKFPILVKNVYDTVGIDNKKSLQHIIELQENSSQGGEYLELFKLWSEFDEFRETMSRHLLGLESSLSSIIHNRVPRSGFRSIETLIDESKRLHDNISGWRSKLKQGMSPYFNPEQLDEYLDSRIHDLNFRLCNINKELGVSK